MKHILFITPFLLAQLMTVQAVFRAPEPGKDTKRVMGLHPDAPLSGRTLRELQEAGLE